MFPKELGKKHNTVKLTEIHAASHLSQDPKWSWSALCLWRHHRIAAGATMCENPQGASIWDGLGIDGRLLRLQKHQKRCHWRPCGAKVHSCLLGRFFMRWYKMYALEWWTFIEKRRWQLTQLLPNQSRGRLHIKSDHKHLFDEFRLLAVWRYPSDFFFCPAWATLRLFCTAAEQDAGLVGVGMGFSEACGWNKWMSLNDLMIHDRNVRHAN